MKKNDYFIYGIKNDYFIYEKNDYFIYKVKNKMIEIFFFSNFCFILNYGI